MSDSLWRLVNDPRILLGLDALRNSATDGQLRLFACACSRRIWDLLPDSQSREAIAYLEQLAEGSASREELAWRATAYLEAVADWDGHDINLLHPTSLVVSMLHPHGISPDFAGYVSSEVAHFRVGILGPLWGEGWDLPDEPNATKLDAFWMLRGPLTEQEEAAATEERRTHCDILRDILANPFRAQQKVAPAVLTWNGGAVSALARTIYEDREYESMPILGDSLEDAGCDDVELLTHCRGPNVHVRGCWALSRVLGVA